jgi:hypothetical protein
VFEIGNSLREARLRRRVELAQAEQATKIRGKYLRALEEEQFEMLPSETYVKGFLRTYADYLGLDGQLYVDEYNSRFVGHDVELRLRRSSRRTSERRARRLETRIVLVVLAAIAAATVVVIGAWTSSSEKPAAATSAAPAAAKPKPAAPVVPALAITAARGPSYVAIHRGGASGPVIFQGTIARGQTEPFLGSSFWVNVSSPENLVIRVRGEKIDVNGFRPRVITVTPTAWHVV